MERLIVAAAMLPSSSALAQVPLAKGADDPALAWGPCPPIFPGNCKLAVLQGDPARPNADVLLRVGPGYELAPHRHSSAERMILVSGTLRVQYDGHPAATLQAGHYAYGPAGLPHRASCLSKAPCTLFIAFEGPIDALPAPGR